MISERSMNPTRPTVRDTIPVLGISRHRIHLLSSPNANADKKTKEHTNVQRKLSREASDRCERNRNRDQRIKKRRPVVVAEDASERRRLYQSGQR
jgi:hypothetical protein